MSAGWAVSCLLIGWILGTWMSWRKILKERRLAVQTRDAMTRELGKRMFRILQEAEVINITVTEEGESEIKFDQAGLDELLGNKTKH